MYQALYRKYRPKNFEDVVGQKAIVKTLENAVINNKVSHAYLFSGPRGTGKTSIAKVFAKIINCNDLNGSSPCNKCVSCTQINNNQNIDVIEIDAASNNGVDEIREIRNKISLVPTNSKYKVYIIDEVHMLTTQAFNALLKTLEEPPAHAIFIFATTEYYKIPKTILSRCQRFDFKKVSIDDIFDRLKYIAKNEKINIDDQAIYEIANLSDGGMRDAISLLDQVNSFVSDKIEIADVHEINGTITPEEISRFMTYFFNKNLIEIINCIEEYDKNGKDLVKIVQEIIEFLKNFLIYININNKSNQNKIFDELKTLTNTNNLYDLIKNFSNSITEMKKTNNVKILFEIEIIKNMNIDTNNKLSSKNITMENKIEQLSSKKTTLENKTEQLSSENITMENIVEKLNDDLLELKKIRINNSLVNFSRMNRDKFKEEIENLRPLLLEPEYSKCISILLDGEIKAITDNSFIIMYNSDLLSNEFNLMLDEEEKMLNQLLKNKYFPIAVSNNEWEIIKKEYAEDKSKYKYIEEPIKKETKKTKSKSKNNIEEIFDDIIEYS